MASEILTEVGGLTGHNVTLPCVYDVDSHGVLDFCWGRGKVPRFKCSDTFLSSEDQSVLNEDPSRYQVLGSPTDGDVSLTIVDAQWSDEGVYGCRIQIPGWFNDIKVNIRLVLEEGESHHRHHFTSLGPGLIVLSFSSSCGGNDYTEVDICHSWGLSAPPRCKLMKLFFLKKKLVI